MTSEPTWKKTACILCSINCGIEVQEADGAFLKIRGDDSHGSSQGYLCQKASRLNFYQNHRARLTHPLKRQADGSFAEISWDQAIAEVAAKLKAIRDEHGGQTIAYYGGGGQGNHLGGAYSAPLREALGCKYIYTALAQEKTGDFWVNGKLYGRQSCFVSEDAHNADYVLVLGANPWIAHGFPQARKVLQELRKDPNRTLVVIDPRVSETAAIADIHLQVKPGRDAFLLSAMIAIMLRDQLVDRAFLQHYTVGFEAIQETFGGIDIAAYCAHAGLDTDLVTQVAHGFAKARRACVRADLGIQQSLHSTLNSYLEKLLYLLTGNFNRLGGNYLAPLFAPLIAHSKDPEEGGLTTPTTGAREISKIFPPNMLPLEILSTHQDRTRAVIVDSANPVMTGADSKAYRDAFQALDLLVVIDVAHTETAQLAHYILPAPSQYEKTEASFFTYGGDYDGQICNFFHLRKPVTAPKGNTLTEAEIYWRLTVALGAIPKRIPVLERAAQLDRRYPKLQAFPLALAAYFKLNPKQARFAPAILYSTLGKALPKGMETAAIVWGISQFYAQRWPAQVRATGLKGKGAVLGRQLFDRFMDNDTGMPISAFNPEIDTWKLLRHKDKKIHLAIPQLLQDVLALHDEMQDQADPAFPFLLMAGERRSYNANQIFRDPAWRKADQDGALRLHPDDAAALGIQAKDAVVCETARGRIQVTASLDDSVQRGTASLPHGYGMRYPGDTDATEWQQHGPSVNELTDVRHCDPIAKTPFHKTVPARIAKVN